jgi:general secretion pathway protein F/type IV pilus assembly protein PilC
MLFKYVGYDKQGKIVKGHLEAESLASVKVQLKYKQITYKTINEDRPSFLSKITWNKRIKLKSNILATISTDLSIYLKSGISLINALRLISQRHSTDKKLNPFFLSVISLMDEGKNFYTALSLQKVIELPEFYLQSIKISEDGGMLQTVLVELANYLKEQDKLNKQIKSAMTYPLFIVVVAVFMVGFMLSFIVPKITAIFNHNNQALPQITQFVINAGDFVNNYYHIMIISIILFISLCVYILKTMPKIKYRFDTLLLKIPFVGSLIEIGELSRFAYMNSILITSGVPVVQSFKLSANILKNSVIKELFIQSSQKVVEGEKLSITLDNSNIYKIDMAFIQAIAIGEETSQLSEILQNLAELYSTRNKDKIGVFLTLLEPIFMLLVGGIIGFIVVAMLLPIFSMSMG